MQPLFSDEVVIDVPAPVGGLVDTTTPDLLDDRDASRALNVHFDRRGISKRLGRVTVGSRRALADYAAQFGYHMRLRTGTELVLVVGGTHLYKLSGATFVGAISGANPATSADVIGGGVALGEAVQYNDRLYYVDGTLRSIYDPGTGTIVAWGPPATQPVAPSSPVNQASGTLLPAKWYTNAYYFRNPTTGVRSRIAVRSAAFQAGGAGTDLPYGGGTVRGTLVSRGQLTQLTPDVPSGSYYSWTHQTPANRTFITTIYDPSSNPIPRSQWTQDSAFDPLVRYVFVTSTYDLAGLLFDGILESGSSGLARRWDITTFAEWQAGMTEIVLLRTRGQATADLAQTVSLQVERTYTGFTGVFPYQVITGETVVGLDTSDEGLQEVVDDGPNDIAAYPVPALEAIILFAERIVGYAGSIVYFSEETGTGTGVNGWPPLNQVEVELDAGDRIRGIFDLGDGNVYVVKESSGVFRLKPFIDKDLFTFQVEKVAAVGCVSHHSIVVQDNFAYWLDRRGAYEFDGTTPRNVSDEFIRATFSRYASNVAIREAVGELDQQAETQYVRWLVGNPDVTTSGGVLVTDQLIFDLSLRRWFVWRAGGAADTNLDTGLFERVAFRVRDAGGEWLYTADKQGYVYRSRTDASRNPVYQDNGVNFTATWRSKLFGNGLDQLLPRHVDFELEHSPSARKDGALVLNFHREGFDGQPQRQAFPLYDSADGAEAAKPRAMQLRAQRCRRFGLELVHDGSGTFTVVRFRTLLKRIGRVLRGR